MSEKVKFVVKCDMEEEKLNQGVNLIEEFIELFDQTSGLDTLKEIKTEIKTKNEDGENVLYEIKIKLITDFGVYHVKEVMWGFNPCMTSAVESIKNQTKIGERR